MVMGYGLPSEIIFSAVVFNFVIACCTDFKVCYLVLLPDFNTVAFYAKINGPRYLKFELCII